MKKIFFNRAVIGWCFYDWASSSFPTLVLTFIFSTYFTQSVAKNALLGTSLWGDMVAISGILIAILSPIFGTLADRQGHGKLWLGFFTGLLILCSALLWFIKPSENYAMLMLYLVGFGLIAHEIAAVFYNAMLKSLAPESHIGRISGWAWGFGYVGGLFCLTIALMVFIEENHASWLNHRLAEHIRICGPFVALWIFIFSLPLFFWTPAHPVYVRATRRNLFQDTFSTLLNTLKKLPQHQSIFIFLIAHMLFLDGLNTLFAFGGIYAAGTFGMSLPHILLFGIMMNVAAGLGAFGFAWLDDKWGPKETILLSLFFMFIAGSLGLYAKTVSIFVGMSLVVGLLVGPVQASSRSLLTRLSPEKYVTEFFGLYAFSGKATAFLNPWLVGMFTLYFHSQRIGMSTVMIFICIGALLLMKVNSKPNS